jgi:hypothetical protein
VTTIQAIGTNSYSDPLSSISSVLASSGLQSASSITSSRLGTDCKEVSKPGEFFNKLKNLQETDPAKFKETVSKIADELENASKDSSLGNATGMLTDLAKKFRDVANGGDIAQLQPPQPPTDTSGVSGAHKHQHHHKAQQYSQQGQTSTDMITSAGAQSNSGDKVKELMDKIFSEVGVSTASSTSTSAVA